MALKRVLIANRGEIAIRIARAAAALGMESVSVHAPADALSLHTRVTDETRQIGAGADPVKAYLDIDAIIEAARETACDCVHPGYGFLAENAEFARRCLAEELVFVGPIARGARPLRRQGGGPRARQTRRRADHPRQRHDAGGRRGGGRDRRRARLSGNAESGGRRRRARHAACR